MAPTTTPAKSSKRFPSVRLISYPENRGKSFAMATGVEAAQCELLMLLDADLTGLSFENVTDLAAPRAVRRGGCQPEPEGGTAYLIFRIIDLDFVTGERVVRKEILSEALDEVFRLPRFGIEVFMNRQIIARRLSISVTRWPKVSQSRKTEKLGYWKGIRAEWRMIADLLRVSYPVALVTQTCQLLSLRTQRSGVVKSVIRILKLRYSEG